MCDLTTGEVIREFDSIKSADAFFGKTNGNISRVASGKNKHAYGYKWAYAE